MTFLRRSLLYIPGSSSRMLEKSRTLVKADGLTFDLEDSVSLSDKAEARKLVRSHLRDFAPAHARQERILRINARHTGDLALHDLEMLKDVAVDSVMLPKVQSAADVTWVSERIPNHCKVLCLIESALAVVNLGEIARHPNVGALIFAAEDYAADVGVTRTKSLLELVYARQAVVNHAKAFHLDPVDLVCTSFKDPAALKEECEEGARFGFTGKQCIHPNQVDVVNEAYSPSQDMIDWAKRLLDYGATQSRGAYEFEGKMIDAPVIKLAQGIVDKFAASAA